MEMYEKLMKKQEEFEAGHIKVRNDVMFRWFEEEGLEILKDYCDIATDFDYEVADSGITVKIITKELLMLPAGEKWLMEVIARAGAVYIKPLSEKKIEIKLWFRGWKWVEQACSSETDNIK